MMKAGAYLFSGVETLNILGNCTRLREMYRLLSTNEEVPLSMFKFMITYLCVTGVVIVSFKWGDST